MCNLSLTYSVWSSTKSAIISCLCYISRRFLTDLPRFRRFFDGSEWLSSNFDGFYRRNQFRPSVFISSSNFMAFSKSPSMRNCCSSVLFVGCPLKVSLKCQFQQFQASCPLRQSQDASLHVGDSRNVGYNIIFLVATERVLQVLIFLPFAASVLLWVLVEEVFCSSSSSIINTSFCFSNIYIST